MFQLQKWWIKSSSYLAREIPNWLQCPFTPPTFNIVPWKMLVLEDYFSFGMGTFHGLCQNLGCVPPVQKRNNNTRHVHVGRPCQPIAFRCFCSTQKAPTSLATIPTRPKAEEDTGWRDFWTPKQREPVANVGTYGFLIEIETALVCFLLDLSNRLLGGGFKYFCFHPC